MILSFSKSSKFKNFVDAANLRFSIVRLEGDLEDPISEGVSVETLNRNQTFFVIRHRHESEPFALVCLQITNHLILFVGLIFPDYLNILNGSKGAEQLPKYVFLSFWGKIIDEDAPAGSIHGTSSGQDWVSSQQVAGKGGIPFLKI